MRVDELRAILAAIPDDREVRVRGGLGPDAEVIGVHSVVIGPPWCTLLIGGPAGEVATISLANNTEGS